MQTDKLPLPQVHANSAARAADAPAGAGGTDTIRVLLAADRLDGERDLGLAQALQRDGAISVVGWVGAGGEVLDAVARQRPDVLLVDRDPRQPEALHTIAAVTERYPWVSVVLTVDAATPAELRQAGAVGAREVLVRPFADGALAACIHRVYHLDAARRSDAGAWAAPPSVGQAQVFVFFGAKGGLGCTTLACNTAVALKRSTGKRVAIVDGGLLFGDVAMVLNLPPKPTLADLAGTVLGDDSVTRLLVAHETGIQALLAPPAPEKAELVTAEHVRHTLAALRDQFDYVVVDTWPSFDDRTLELLDAATRIVVPTTLELPALKNTRLLLALLGDLRYPSERIACVLNRAGSRTDVKAREAEQVLGQAFAATVSSDWRLATAALGRGKPFVAASPEATISKQVAELATLLAGTGERARPSWARAFANSLRGGAPAVAPVRPAPGAPEAGVARLLPAGARAAAATRALPA